MAMARLCALLILMGRALPALQASPVPPNPRDFAGQWKNVDPATRGLTRVEIRVQGRDSIGVHPWGKCHPQDCDWGESDARAVPGAFSWPFRDQVAMRSGTVFIERGQLVIRMVSRYQDNRPETVSVDRFQRASDASGTAVSGAGPSGATSRRIKPDGSAEIKYADGTVKTVTKTGYTIRHPDGKMTSAIYSQIPPSFPAIPSDERTARWLTAHADSLLGMIRAVAGDEGSVNDFLQGEQGLGLWEMMQRQTDALRFLLTP